MWTQDFYAIHIEHTKSYSFIYINMCMLFQNIYYNQNANFTLEMNRMQ